MEPLSSPSLDLTQKPLRLVKTLSKCTRRERLTNAMPHTLFLRLSELATRLNLTTSDKGNSLPVSRSCLSSTTSTEAELTLDQIHELAVARKPSLLQCLGMEKEECLTSLKANLRGGQTSDKSASTYETNRKMRRMKSSVLASVLLITPSCPFSIEAVSSASQEYQTLKQPSSLRRTTCETSPISSICLSAIQTAQPFQTKFGTTFSQTDLSTLTKSSPSYTPSTEIAANTTKSETLRSSPLKSKQVNELQSMKIGHLPEISTRRLSPSFICIALVNSRGTTTTSLSFLQSYEEMRKVEPLAMIRQSAVKLHAITSVSSLTLGSSTPYIPCMSTQQEVALGDRLLKYKAETELERVAKKMPVFDGTRDAASTMPIVDINTFALDAALISTPRLTAKSPLEVPGSCFDELADPRYFRGYLWKETCD